MFLLLNCTMCSDHTMMEPLLYVDQRYQPVVMCILYLVIRIGDYLTKFIRCHCKTLPPLARAFE